MPEIQCHSSTPKSEVINFVKEHKGKKMQILFEMNMYKSWGDNALIELDIDTTKQIRTAITLIETHYIHHIKTL